MFRYDIINYFIKEYNCSSYLEIGTQNRNQNFNKIHCKIKTCVDPDINAKADFVMTSDEFFKNNKQTFDIIFIDGLHEAHQVYRDIQNSLKVLNKGGIIICHDCNPISEKLQVSPEVRPKGEWNGDCWKAFVKYRFESEYECYVIDEDYGCGVINTNNSSKINKCYFNIDEMKYDLLDKNRKELLGLTK